MVRDMNEKSKTIAEKIDELKCNIYAEQKLLDKCEPNSPEFLEYSKLVENAEIRLHKMQDSYDVWNKLLERSRQK